MGSKIQQKPHRNSFINHNPSILVKERDRVNGDADTTQTPLQPEENKKQVLNSFEPVIKHLLEQAESKCTADKENITMSPKPDRF